MYARPDAYNFKYLPYEMNNVWWLDEIPNNFQFNFFLHSQRVRHWMLRLIIILLLKKSTISSFFSTSPSMICALKYMYVKQFIHHSLCQWFKLFHCSVWFLHLWFFHFTRNLWCEKKGKNEWTKKKPKFFFSSFICSFTSKPNQ